MMVKIREDGVGFVVRGWKDVAEIVPFWELPSAVYIVVVIVVVLQRHQVQGHQAKDVNDFVFCQHNRVVWELLEDLDFPGLEMFLLGKDEVGHFSEQR